MNPNQQPQPVVPGALPVASSPPEAELPMQNFAPAQPGFPLPPPAQMPLPPPAIPQTLPAAIQPGVMPAAQPGFSLPPAAQMPLPPPAIPQTLPAAIQPGVMPAAQPFQPTPLGGVIPPSPPSAPPPEMVDGKIFTKPFTIILLVSVLLVFVVGLLFWSYIRTP